MVKSITKICLSFCLACNINAFSAGEFITIWDLSKPGPGDTELTFGVETAGTVSYSWETFPIPNSSGVGTFSGTTFLATGLPANTTIRLKIAPTNFQRININNGLDRARLIDITQWGTCNWTSMVYAFYGCVNLEGNGASDVPNLSNVTDMSGMFLNARAFNQPIGGWNTANVTNMNSMFYLAGAFNQSIGGWNTSNVTNMGAMFNGARAFNQPIGGWNVANVYNMAQMFNDATAFNQPIGGWNVANVNNMSEMFRDATAFNQPIGGWNTSNVTEMVYMFHRARAFNQSIGGWNTSNVTSMIAMFLDATSFNQPIGGWNTGNVTNMGAMFNGAFAFNQNLSAWGTRLHPTVDLFNFIVNSGMNGTNYDALLTGFNAGTVTGRSLGALNVRYCSAGAARANLISTGVGGKMWTINDSGLASNTSIVTQPLASANLPSGTLQIFEVSATGSNLRYMWTNGLSNTSSMSTSVAGIYFVTVTGSCGTAVSNAASLTTTSPCQPTTIQPFPSLITVCSGISVPIVATATGSNLVYAWNTGISGASATVSTSGTYIVTVTGACGVKVSNPVQVNVNDCTPTSTNLPTYQSTFSIYPNPTSGTFTIEVSLFEKVELLSYTISSIEGKVVTKGQLISGKNEITTALSKGIYFVKVGNAFKKLIIE